MRRRLLRSYLRATGQFSPEVLLFDLTHRCNSRCQGCGFREAEPGELSAIRWVELAQEGKELGFSELQLTGGEPLLHPEISELLPKLSAVLPVSVITNGLLLARYRDLLKIHVQALYISWDGWDAESYARVRGVRGFEVIKKGISELRGKVSLHARVTVWGQSVGRLGEIAGSARDAGFDRVSFLAPDLESEGFGDRSGMLGAVVPGAEQVPELLKELESLASLPYLGQSRASLMRVGSLVSGARQAPFCVAPWTAGLVGPSGQWRRCFFLGSPENVDSGLKMAIQNDKSGRGFRPEENPVCQRCVCWRG